MRLKPFPRAGLRRPLPAIPDSIRWPLFGWLFVRFNLDKKWHAAVRGCRKRIA
jgi:hypothetical protein